MRLAVGAGVGMRCISVASGREHVAVGASAAASRVRVLVAPFVVVAMIVVATGTAMRIVDAIVTAMTADGTATVNAAVIGTKRSSV